jgi:DNA-binding NarL/FixJ family response regulator
VHVVIAEDSVLLRAGIQRLLADENIEVVAAVEDGDGLLIAVSEHRPDLAIVDVRMPPTFTDEGLRAALAAREQLPGLPVLVLSQYVEERYAVEWPMSPSSSTRCTGWPVAARASTRR